MALKLADTLVSCNPDYYGIAKAKEIIGHKFVSNLESLYQIPDCILSESKYNTNNDAIGQKWYVTSEDCYFQLIDWNNRKSSSGWKKDIVDLNNLVTEDEINEKLSEKQEKLIPGIGIEIDSLTNEIKCTIDTDFIRVVSSLPEPSEDLMNKIYIIPATIQKVNNKYEEYFIIKDADGIFSWELFGSCSIDFSDYLKKEDANNLFIDKESFEINNNLINEELSNKVSNEDFLNKLNEKASKTIATTSEDGLMSSEDKQNLDSILEGNISVVSPTITGTWKFFNYRGDTSLTITPSPDNFNPIIEKGYKAQFTGTYIWNHEEGKKDPTSTGQDSDWISLPMAGIQSSSYTSKKLDKTTLIKVSIRAPKTGLMITEDNGIVLASGFDYSYDSRSISFLDRVYFGKSTKGIRTISEEDVRELSSELVDSLNFSVNDVTCYENEYFVFAYPKELGDLSNITQNYVQSISESFSMKSLNIINGAGLGILLNIYVSNNPGAFYDSTLNFY